MTKIFARNCEVKKISNSEAEEFCLKHHKQGWASSTVSYGLYYNNELVQVESFGIPIIEIQNNCQTHDWELKREVSKNDVIVVGGKSKLLKTFEREYHPLNILSYCSMTDGFDGHSYVSCGFTEISRKKSYHYEKDGKKFSRYRFQKNSNLKEPPIKKTIEKMGGVYYPNETEVKNAELNGFKKVIDLGNIVFEKKMFKPYVYLVTNKDTKEFYIGMKRSFGNKGNIIGIDYFTSSTDENFVEDFKNNRDKYDVKILKFFDMSDEGISECANYEAECIKNSKEDDKIINKAYWSAYPCPTSVSYMREAIKNKNISGENNPFYGKQHTEETKKIISEKTKIAMEKYGTANMIKAITGRKLSEEHKAKIRERMITNNPFYGKHHTEETKKIISEKKKGVRMSEEQKKHLSEIFTGRKRSAESIEKGAKKLIGHTVSEETRRKISNNRKCAYYMCVQTNEVKSYKEWLDEGYEIRKRNNYVSKGLQFKKV